MQTSLAFALALLATSVPAISKAADELRVETPGGPITAKRKIAPPEPQQVVLATTQEIRNIGALASQAKGFVETYRPGVQKPALKDFDEAFRVWQRERIRRFTEKQVVEILGAHLGSRLVEELDMEWVVVTDKYGTDYAVRAKKSEVMSFPFSSVAKRVEDNKYDFMVGVYHTVKQMIASGEYKVR
jgi:hypothetical protein